MKVFRRWKARAYRRFRIRARPRGPVRSWFTPHPQKRVIGIGELHSNEYYAFTAPVSRGGFRTKMATGSQLQLSWRNALAAHKETRTYDSFMAAYLVCSEINENWRKPIGRWRTVLLTPRSDLYFQVQPVLRRHAQPT